MPEGLRAQAAAAFYYPAVLGASAFARDAWGTPPKGLFIGKTSAGEFVVAVTGVNACVGEMGVLTDAPRSATVRATSKWI